ncbi:MAG TPA: hypothetical protein DCP91_00030 [Eggerthellaceae bacterium]|nr:hypothetical protein [Eggerthellaceae bacterium]
MSQYLTMAQLVVLGSNLCSKYYLDPDTKEIMHRKSLTTRERIARYLDTGEKIYGAGKAKKALVYVEDRSASPMETKTHVLVCLPLHKGGHGFAKPVFNYEVNPGRYAHLAEQGHFEIDLCWVDEKVGIEYFGEKEHPDPIRDRRRLDALGALGWKIVVVDKRRLANPDSFEIAMKQVARHLGRRIRKPDGWAEKNLALRREIGIA